MTQTKGSIKEGVRINVSPSASAKLLDKDIKPILIAAKKVLPVSPINIFAGYQFQVKNAANEPSNNK